MDEAFVIAAAVQAAAAIAIAVLTARLASFTSDYVAEMRRLNALQGEANRITAASLATAQGQTMPRLVAQQRGRKADDTRVEAPFDVFNLGGGPAESVVLVTSWGEGSIREPIPAGGQARCVVGMPRREWEAGSDPVVLGFRFRDGAGTDHEVKASE